MFHRIHEANGGMDRLSVAASRQSAAGCCSHELRRSAETPLRQGSWLRFTSNLGRCPLSMNLEEHPTSNIEWQRESSLTSAFEVRCSPSVRGFQRSNFHFGE